MLLNKGFNLSQAENRDRFIFSASYGTSHVRNAILHPLQSIDNTGGWGNFIEEQILPVQALKWIPLPWNHLAKGRSSGPLITQLLEHTL